MRHSGEVVPWNSWVEIGLVQQSAGVAQGFYDIEAIGGWPRILQFHAQIIVARRNSLSRGRRC
jgi:hypothetical protein